MIRFTVPGEPVAKGRPRFNRKTGVTYTPDRTARFEERVCLFAAQAGMKRMDGPILLEIAAVWEWPRSKWRKREPRTYGIKCNGPDADNVAKAVMDGLKPFFDDRQVAQLKVSKWHARQGEEARTMVYVEAL